MSDKETEDAKAFGAGVWVYCAQHLRPHETGWCTVGTDQKTPLAAKTYSDAHLECRQRGFTLCSPK